VLEAYPDSGWTFGGWSGDLSGSTNPDTILMDSNKSVTVTFNEIPEYSLSVNIVGSGVVTVNGSSPYAAGSVVVLEAYPDSGWTFGGWSGDLSGSTNPDTILMDSNKSVTVTFNEKKHKCQRCCESKYKHRCTRNPIKNNFPHCYKQKVHLGRQTNKWRHPSQQNFKANKYKRR
jgi:uncharacterized repeat protein (TIGR02543 family)